MKLPMIVARLCASGMLVCASGGAIADPIAETEFGTPKFEGKQTVNSGSVAIESTLLASSAVDAAAQKIAERVGNFAGKRKVLVIGGAEVLDFGQVAMIQTEIAAIHNQLVAAMTIPPSTRTGISAAAIPLASIIPAVAGLMRSDTEFTAHEVTLDPRILPSAVAARLGATLFSAKIGANTQSTLLVSFQDLEELALAAQQMHDRLASKGKDQSEQDKRMVERLAAALKRYDSFFNRVTTANEKTGAVPLATAARLAQVIEEKPLILRVNTEKAGGTTVKRTNLLTFFGADGLSISGGLVASYQLTDPESGTVTTTGVITCRTALTKLKSVQDASWKARGSDSDTPQPPGQTAVCRDIGFSLVPTVAAGAPGRP